MLLLPGSAKLPASKDVERQRSNFFQSLRRTSAKNVDTDRPAPPSSPSTPPAQTVPPVKPPSDPAPTTTQPNTASSNGIASSQQNGTVAGNGMSNGHDHERRHSWDASDPRSKVSAEEEAFLRSLGWTEPGDDEDGESPTRDHSQYAMSHASKIQLHVLSDIHRTFIDSQLAVHQGKAWHQFEALSCWRKQGGPDSNGSRFVSSVTCVQRPSASMNVLLYHKLSSWVVLQRP